MEKTLFEIRDFCLSLFLTVFDIRILAGISNCLKFNENGNGYNSNLNNNLSLTTCVKWVRNGGWKRFKRIFFLGKLAPVKVPKCIFLMEIPWRQGTLYGMGLEGGLHLHTPINSWKICKGYIWRIFFIDIYMHNIIVVNHLMACKKNMKVSGSE